MNQVEVITTMLKDLGLLVQKFKQAGGMAPPDKLQGMMGIAAFVGQSIKILSADKEAKPMVAAFGKVLMKLGNELKGFQQRLQEQQKKQAQAGNGAGAPPDPKAIAQAKAIEMQAQIKAKNAAQSHAEKTAQRRISFEQKQKQDAQKHQSELIKGAQSHKMEMAKEIQKSRMKSVQE